MSIRTPRELIELYWDEIWNKGQVELIREICADPMLRHTTKAVERLSHDEQIERVRKNVEALQPRFTHEVLVADATHVSSVWNMRSKSERFPQMSGIETFRAVNGRFTECWNPPYGFALWDGKE